MKDFEPVIITTSERAQTTDDEETIHVFSIDGVDYGIPVHPPGNLGFLFTDAVADEGESRATVWLLRELLGDDGYEALRDCDVLTDDERERILAMVVDHGLAASEASQGNRLARRSSRRAGGRGSTSKRTTSTRTSDGSTGSRSKKRSTT